MSNPSIHASQNRSYDATRNAATDRPITSVEPHQTHNAKERKRIQNRSAQRSYRSRVKTRLKDLQARLDAYENANMQAGNNVEITRDGVTPKSKTPADTTFGPSLTRNPEVETRGLDPRAVFHESNASQHTAVDAVSQSLSLDSATGSYSDEGGRAIHGLSMLPQSSTQSPAATRSSLSKTDESGASHRMDFGNEASVLLSNESSNEMISLSDFSHVPLAEDHLPNPLEYGQAPGLDFAPLCDDSVSIDQVMSLSEHSSTISLSGISTTAEATLRVRDQSVTFGRGEAIQIPLETRMESVLEHIEQQGFDSFDSVVALYYGRTFAKSSSLTSEQWLSRNRRLPSVIASILDSSADWNQSEARNLNDEMFKASENLLTGEIDAARAGILLQVKHVSPQGSYLPTAEIYKPDILGMRDELMSKCPYWSTLLMRLMSANRSLPQRNRANIGLAINLMIFFSGTWDKQLLLKLLDVVL